MAEPASDFRQQLIDLLPRLGRFSRSLTRSREDADDLLQSAVERALTRGHLWDPSSRFDSWMYRLTQNLWIDCQRSALRLGPSVDPADFAAVAGEDGRDTTEKQFLANKVRTAMATLPNEQRLVVALVLVEGLSYKEAAEQLEWPIGTVMSRLARARQAIFNEVGVTSLAS
jgi:RNA polymerase sigma-70 factor, ECF subfamily